MAGSNRAHEGQAGLAAKIPHLIVNSSAAAFQAMNTGTRIASLPDNTSKFTC
jgi:hypothetical protein